MPPRSVSAVAPSCIWSNIFNLSTGAVHVRLIAPAMPAQRTSSLLALFASLFLAPTVDVEICLWQLQGNLG